MKVFQELSKKAQLYIWASSTLITILSYLLAYKEIKDVSWFPFAVASLINVLKSVIDYLMGRAPETAA